MRRRGRSYAHPLLVLIVDRSEREGSRFAVSAGKSVGNAVKRNRAKRLIRAALRPMLAGVEKGWNGLIIARAPLAEADYHQTQKALKTLFNQAALLESGFYENRSELSTN